MNSRTHRQLEAQRTFTITFVPRGGVDGVKAVRRLLKYAGRYLGLRAIDIQERATNGGIRATEHFGAVLDLIARANNSRR